MVESRSWPILLAACVSAFLVLPTYCQSGGLMVTTPRVWVAGGQENVCIVSHALIPEVVCIIEVRHEKKADSFIQKNVTIASGGSVCVEVPVPQNISASTAQIVVTATSLDSSIDYDFNKSADVSIQRATRMTFIETDKPIYKPGDLVRIRILTLTGPDLKLLRGDILLAYIEDPSRTRVMQWANISTVNGLGSLEMQLSDEPRLGEWTIKAVIQSEVAMQKFTVKEYVLPKFEVAIHHPSHLFSGFSVVEWKVCARYTYGQPVHGNVISSICLVHAYRSNPRCQLMNATQLKNGCAEFSVSSSDIDMNRFMWNTAVKFDAEVKEHGTGVKLNSTSTAEVHTSSFKLKLIPEASASHHYKPGLPYYGQGQVTRPDGTPAVGKMVRIRTDARKNGVNNGNVTSFPVLDLTTDKNGMFKYFLPGTFTSQDMNSIYQHVTVGKGEEGNVHRAPTVSRTLKAWFSLSNSFLQIEPFEGIASCRSSVSLPVDFVMGNSSNSPLTFYFQLVTRGDIVHAGQLTASPVADRNLESNGKNLYKFNVTFTVTPRMSGSTQVLLFTVLASGETVADSMMIAVENCFHNQVAMGFTDQQKQPGHQTTLRLSADPHSLCSISVVDKSVKLMDKADNSLSESKVFGMLKQYDIPQNNYNQHYGRFRHEEDCGTIADELELSDGPAPMFDAPLRPRRLQRSKRTIMFPETVQSEYVDSKKAFVDAGMIVLSDLTVVTRPCSRPLHRYFQRYRDGGFRGMVLASPGVGPMPIPMAAAIDSEPKFKLASSKPVNSNEIPVLHRTFYPESWLWQLTSVGDSGTEDVNLNLPHTITEWIGNGFCTNSQSGLGVASPFSINAFQPFFLSFTLPYSMIRGERVGIPVSVFNYMNQCLKVTLYVKKSTAFELNSNSPVTELRVCGHQTETHTYYIVPRELGNINFTIKASSVAADNFETNSIEEREIMTAEDIMTQKLLVEAEGKEEEQTKSAFVCAPAEGSFSIGLPDGLVEDSVRSFTSIIGDVMGPTLTGLESLLALPTGCGEQNMLKFSPNIFILQYLEKTNSLTENIRAKAVEFLQTGYQRELTYRHKDGSYSAFGESDKEGSIWLTAFVVKSFAQAQPFIYIDQKDLQKSIKWITSIQLENGCFPQVGRVLHKEMKGGMAGNDDNFAALTAYILIALMEAGLPPQDPVILRAVQCLEIQQVPVWDVYTQSLMAYAYTMRNRNETKRAEIMNALAAKVIAADGMKHWNMPNDSSSSPAATEMTSYVLLAMLHNAEPEVIAEATPVVRWLSTQRNGQGGFSSTQDTVLALQALAQFAALVYRDDFDARVMLTGAAWNYNVSVTNDNRLLLQKQEGQTLPSTLKYAVSGTGCVLLQASVKYNIITYQKEQETAFLLNVEVHRSKSNNCKERSLKICTSYNGVDNASNMAVIAVKMVSGWIPDKDSIKKLTNHVGLRLKRFEIEKSIVHLYFDELDKTEKCFSFLVHQNIIVTKTKPALVHVYDYYKPSLSAYDDYSITTTCGTKEEIKEEGNEPLESKNITQMRLRRVRPSRIEAVKVKDHATKKPSHTKCPTCNWNNLTEVKRKFCSTPHAYEAMVVNRTMVNVLKEMHSNVEIKKNVSYRLAPKCANKCAVLKEGAQVVFMLPKPIVMRKQPVSLKLDINVVVVERSKIGLIAATQNMTICP